MMFRIIFWDVGRQSFYTAVHPRRQFWTSERRKLHNEQLHILYSSPNIIRQIKSRRMRLAGHVARMWEECVQGFDGKARRKETTWKNEAYMGEWDQNGS
jgi:hypothetical protein